MSGTDGEDARREECEVIVASHVVRALVSRGIEISTVGELLRDKSLRLRDLALLGLGSLDWMALATQLEDATGVELPDLVLLEPEHRCVTGWAEALFVEGAGSVLPGIEGKTHA